MYVAELDLQISAGSATLCKFHTVIKRMSYLGAPYLHDIFVSYAHGASNSGNSNGGLKSWTLCLAQEINAMAADLVMDFEGFDLFIDEQMNPTMPLTDSIREKVRRSGLLMIVMSDHYLRSSWCQDELDWFSAEVERKGSNAAEGRVVVVKVHPTKSEAWPSCLLDQRGFAPLGISFYEPPTRPNEVVTPFGWPRPRPDDEKYHRRVNELVTTISQQLRKLKNIRETNRKINALQYVSHIQGKPKVHLLVPRDADHLGQHVKMKLEQIGLDVLTAPPQIANPANDMLNMCVAHRSYIEFLAKEAHAVCLIRSEETSEFSRELNSLIADMAYLQAKGKNIPCVVIDFSSDCNSSDQLAGTSIEIINDNCDFEKSVLNWLHGNHAHAS